MTSGNFDKGIHTALALTLHADNIVQLTIAHVRLCCWEWETHCVRTDIKARKPSVTAYNAFNQSSIIKKITSNSSNKKNYYNHSSVFIYYDNQVANNKLFQTYSRYPCRGKTKFGASQIEISHQIKQMGWATIIGEVRNTQSMSRPAFKLVLARGIVLGSICPSGCVKGKVCWLFFR